MPNPEVEIRQTARRLLAEGRDLHGRQWQMFTYKTPSGRVCVENSFPEISDTEFVGMCDETLFDLSLARIQRSSYTDLPGGFLAGVVAGNVSEIRFLDARGEVVVGPVAPIRDGVDDLDVGVFVTTAPPDGVIEAALYSEGQVVESVPIEQR